MPDSEREYAFLNYANEDLEKVRKIYEGLKKRKVIVWLDKADLKFGDPWKSKIMRAINRSKFFVICISNNALKKTSGEVPGFQDEELQYAFQIALNQPEDKFKIVPARLEDCQRGDHRIEMFHQCDLFPDLEKSLDQLAVNLGGKSLSDASAIDERTEDEKILESIKGRAKIFYYSGEYGISLSLFEAAINLKSDDTKSWNNKGVALESLGRYKEALKVFEKRDIVNSCG
jgi:tetratricopeptide (TPR) repeat protein